MDRVYRAASPFPTIGEDGIVTDGIRINAPTRCMKCKHHDCLSLPSSTSNEKVVFGECKDGFSVFTGIVNFHVVRVVGILDLAQSELASSEFKKIYRSQKVLPSEVENWFNRIRGVLPVIQSAVMRGSEDLLHSLHEVKTACSAIIRNTEALVASVQGANFDEKLNNAPDPVRALFASAELLIQQLQMSSISINPDAATTSTPHGIQVHRLFFKYSKILDAVARNKGVEIRTGGFSESKTIGYDSLALIPLVLIQNAIKYTPRQKGFHIKVSVDDSANQIRANVENVGPQIKESDYDRIFEKGFRTSDVSSDTAGYGVGLYIAQTVARAHDTLISVRSQQFQNENFMNTFSVTFDATRQ